MNDKHLTSLYRGLQGLARDGALGGAIVGGVAGAGASAIDDSPNTDRHLLAGAGGALAGGLAGYGLSRAAVHGLNKIDRFDQAMDGLRDAADFAHLNGVGRRWKPGSSRFRQFVEYMENPDADPVQLRQMLDDIPDTVKFKNHFRRRVMDNISKMPEATRRMFAEEYPKVKGTPYQYWKTASEGIHAVKALYQLKASAEASGSSPTVASPPPMQQAPGKINPPPVPITAAQKVAFNLGSIKQNWNAFKNSPMPEHMLAGATIGGLAGSVAGSAYGYGQDFDTQDRYARNGMLGGMAIGALGGLGTGYRAQNPAQWSRARVKGRKWEPNSNWQDYTKYPVGSSPNHRVHVKYDDARHGAPLKKVWDVVQGSSEFHDPAVASAASDFMSAVGTAKGTPEYLQGLIAKMPPDSKAAELFRVMMNRNIKTAAYLATWALFGFPT